METIRSTLLKIALVLLLTAHAAPAGADEHFGPPVAPAGFRIEPAVQNLHHPTRLAFGPDGRLYIAQQTGEVIAVTLKEGKETARDQVAKAKLHLLGITLKDEKLWVSDTGAIAVYTRTPDGRYAGRREIVTQIPHGLHQNDGFAWGPDGKLYWGLGSTTDRGPEQHPWSGTVMRMSPDGSGVEVYARGFRNPYGLAFDPDGNLWVTDNGADDPASSDELNLVKQNRHYGFPDVFEMPPAGSQTEAPVALFGDHNSTNGLAIYSGTQFPQRFRGQAFVAMWGSSFDDSVGRAVGLVHLNEPKNPKVEPFITGLTRPLDLIQGPDGDLWVADFVPGIVYRIWFTGPDPQPAPAPNPAPAAGPATAIPWFWVAAAVAAIALLATARKLQRKRG